MLGRVPTRYFWGVKKETEGDHSLCDDNNCGKMKALPSDSFTNTDECYELAEYGNKNSEGKDIKITIEQDITEIHEF
jgi:hypothetical protein